MKKQKQTHILPLEQDLLNSYSPVRECPKSWGQLPQQEASGTLALRAPPLRVWGGEITKGWSFSQAVPHWEAQPNLDMIPVLLTLIPTSRRGHWTQACN